MPTSVPSFDTPRPRVAGEVSSTAWRTGVVRLIQKWRAALPRPRGRRVHRADHPPLTRQERGSHRALEEALGVHYLLPSRAGEATGRGMTTLFRIPPAIVLRPRHCASVTLSDVRVDFPRSSVVLGTVSVARFHSACD